MRSSKLAKSGKRRKKRGFQLKKQCAAALAGRLAERQEEEVKELYRAVMILLTILIVSGCASKSWYEDYGLSELDLHSDKGIDTAAKVMSEGSRRQKFGASDYLERAAISEAQADILAEQLKSASHEYAVRRIIYILMEKGYAQQALPGLIVGLNHRDGNIRVLSLKYLANIGCDAREALPMARVISTNDGRGVQERAKIAIRRISLDCMSKGIDIEGDK